MLKRDPNPKSINFLQPINKSDNIWANAYLWVFDVGKYMLIVVELVALSVFVSRFILDEKNNDLTKDINSQVTILSSGSWKQNNIKYANIQSLLFDISKIEKEQKLNSALISEIKDGIPGSLNIESFSFNNGNVAINLKTTNFQAFRDYESALKNNPSYKEVKVNTVKDATIYDIRINFFVDQS